MKTVHTLSSVWIRAKINHDGNSRGLNGKNCKANHYNANPDGNKKKQNTNFTVSSTP